ncbi:AccI family restriction endonuclease [Flavobacterium ajazii]|uniref:AccI family restriction endonuclease n=1 Tax=Flavobacterium ajazii TaxID=2692318 RepID=UPI0013D29A37|nr:AccI family restriction endonuclease [Flavobacterium ajazii]
MKPAINIYAKFLVLIFLIFSCSSDLDFDQVNDLKLEPVVVANLTYFDIAAHAFVDDGNEHSIAFDSQDFNPFRNSLMREDLIKTEFNFEITNTIKRAYKIDLLLIDGQNNTIETLNFDIPAYSGGNSVFNFTEVFENQRLANLKRLQKIGFVVTMEAGPPLTENSPGNLKLRSAATLNFDIEIEE